MKMLYINVLIIVSGIMISTSICKPALISKNAFVEEFVIHDTLNIMAVIMTIAVATIATIHIWFNELEAKHEKKVFGKARREINHDAFMLIFLFLAELFVLIVRAYFGADELAISLFDSAAIVTFLCSVASLIDIMNVVRALTPSD